jgi:hypothetical protein
VPTVPYKASPSVEPLAAPTTQYFEPRVSADTFGGYIAKGVEKAGNEVSQVADVWGGIQVDAQINKALGEGSSIINDYRENKRGQDALDQQDAVHEHLNEVVERNGAGLSPNLRAHYDTAIRRYQFSTWNGEITTHAAQAAAQVAKETNTGTFEEAINRGAAANTPEELQGAVQDATHATQAQARFNGFGGDAKAMDNAERTATMEVYKAHAERIFTVDKRGALDFVRHNEAKLGAAATPLEDKFVAGAQRDWEEQKAGLIGQRDDPNTPPATRVELQKQIDAMGNPPASRPSNVVPIRPGAPTTLAPASAAAPGEPARQQGQSGFDYMKGSRVSLSPRDVAANIQIESGNKPQYGGHYQGLAQFSPSEQRRFGVTDPNNRTQVATALQLEANENRSALTQALGHEPTPSDYYLAHQQGQAGAIAHLTHPQQLAWQSMASTGEGRARGEAWAKRAIWGNMTDSMKAQFPGGVNTVTSGAFVSLWAARYGRAAGQQQAAVQ